VAVISPFPWFHINVGPTFALVCRFRTWKCGARCRYASLGRTESRSIVENRWIAQVKRLTGIQYRFKGLILFLPSCSHLSWLKVSAVADDGPVAVFDLAARPRLLATRFLTGATAYSNPVPSSVRISGWTQACSRASCSFTRRKRRKSTNRQHNSGPWHSSCCQ
jgi:hypothetical protein